MKYKILETSFLGDKIYKDKTYTIIGAGISGLLLGFYLKSANVAFKIIEQSDRSGGLLGTSTHKQGISEHAANGFIWCPEIQHLCDKLGITIQKPKSVSKARYLVRDKQLKKMPLSYPELFGAIGSLILPHPQKCATIKDFGHQFLGAKMTRQILEPAFAGIYGADIAKLSLPGALTPVAKLLNKSSNIPFALLKNKFSTPANEQKKRQSGTHGFAGGMKELVNALTAHLSQDIAYQEDGLKYKDSTDEVIVTTPAYVAASFFDGELKEILNSVEYTSIISCTLFFKKEDLKSFKEGFGCLIPRNEGLTILGVLFNSCIFDHRVFDDQYISLTCILRDDTADRRIFEMLDIDIKSMIVKELDTLFDIRANPLDYGIYRWPKGIPLYSPKLYNDWFRIDELLKTKYQNRHLFGNYTGEISIRGMCQMASKII